MTRKRSPNFETWKATETSNSLHELSEIAGRVCYDSFNKGRKTNKEYLDNIINHKHFSVLEHANVTFGIQGISRACSHELVRHRHFSFSQRSQRYCTELEFVEHPSLSAEERATLELDCMALKLRYEDQMRNTDKKDRERLRMELPNCVETKMVVTGNLRAWREFLDKRLKPEADAEIRQLAYLILAELQELAPHVFADYV